MSAQIFARPNSSPSFYKKLSTYISLRVSGINPSYWEYIIEIARPRTSFDHEWKIYSIKHNLSIIELFALFFRGNDVIFDLSENLLIIRHNKGSSKKYVGIGNSIYMLERSKNKPERVFSLQVRCRELDIFKILEIFWEIFWNLFGIFWIFWNFFGGIFWENFFERIFRRIVFGGILWFILM